MKKKVKTLVLSILLCVLIFKREKVEEPTVINNDVARHDQDEVIPEEQSFPLLDSRGKLYNRNAANNLLLFVRLANSKVPIDESQPPRQMDLNSLTIGELKHLLDQRGIMYYDKSSKHDLMVAVTISGPVTKDAIDHMNRTGEPKEEFMGEFDFFNFDQTIAEHKNSTFLVNIIPEKKRYAYFNESLWKSLRRKLSYMGFLFGELDCSLLKRVCLKQKWFTSILYLHVADGYNIQFPITDELSLHDIFRNIQKTLASRITHIQSLNEFTSSKWAFYNNTNDEVKLRVILLTNMIDAPMFLSVLSVKYRDKVSFGLVDMQSRHGQAMLRKVNQTHWPLCLIVTEQAILVYGVLPEEYFTCSSLDFFIQTFFNLFKNTKQVV